MFEPGQESEPCELDLALPEGFILGGNTLVPGINAFDDYHQLVDTPFFAAKSLKKWDFEVKGLPVNLSLAGGDLPNAEALVKGLKQLVSAQMGIFPDVPTKRYTFWLLLMPSRGRHGVEHLDSTVIIMGPASGLIEKKLFNALLEICSHEFFHIWNVKAMRPSTLVPYDYRQPQYTTLHYITEGITTYYGYLMLWRAQCCTFEEWIGYINGQIQDFYLSGGMGAVSLEEASFNSWVNGYSWAGAPNRRISFYTKGHLVALVLDFFVAKRISASFSTGPCNGKAI